MRGLRELRESLRDPARPLPSAVWFALAALVSLTFFLWLRLVAVRTAPAAREATAVAAVARPDATREALWRVVEAWREALASGDLDAVLACYARTFGARGLDRAGLAEEFERRLRDPPAALAISSFEARAHDAIAIAAFDLTERSPAGTRSERVRLYFLVEDGAWRIFNEEREGATSEAAAVR